MSSGARPGRHRIEDAEGMRRLGDFRPVPYHWDDEPLALREHPDFLTLLRELLAWLAKVTLGNGDTWAKTYLPPQPARSTSLSLPCSSKCSDQGPHRTRA